MLCACGVLLLLFSCSASLPFVGSCSCQRQRFQILSSPKTSEQHVFHSIFSGNIKRMESYVISFLSGWIPFNAQLRCSSYTGPRTLVIIHVFRISLLTPNMNMDEFPSLADYSGLSSFFLLDLKPYLNCTPLVLIFVPNFKPFEFFQITRNQKLMYISHLNTYKDRRMEKMME